MLDKSTNEHLDRIFDQMYNLISAANRIPLTDKIIVEESDLAEIMDDLKEAIPREVKSANKVLEEQREVIEKAHQEADDIVTQAKTEAERILNIAKAEAERQMRKEEIVQEAINYADEVKREATNYVKEVKGEADEYSVRVRTDALEYADNTFEFFNGHLQSALAAFAENRASIEAERKAVLHTDNFEDMQELEKAAAEDEQDED